MVRHSWRVGGFLLQRPCINMNSRATRQSLGLAGSVFTGFLAGSLSAQVPKPAGSAPAAIAKGAQVWLNRDEALYFKTVVHHTGRKGEVFMVLAHQPGASKVFVEFQERGATIALSVAADAVGLAPPDRTSALQAISGAFEKGDYARMATLVRQCAVADPAEPLYPELLSHIPALNAADRAARAAADPGAVAFQKAALLRRNAAAIDQPNRLRPADDSAHIRAEQMRQQADALEAEAASAGTAALEFKEKVRQRLLLPESGTPSAGAPVESVPGGTAAAPHEPIGKMPLLLQAVSIGGKFEAGKEFDLIGLKILQATGKSVTVTIPDEYTPVAMIVFPNPDALAQMPMKTADFAFGTARFVEFRDVPLTSGASNRLPVFEAVSFGTNGVTTVNTEKKE